MGLKQQGKLFRSSKKTNLDGISAMEQAGDSPRFCVFRGEGSQRAELQPRPLDGFPKFL